MRIQVLQHVMFEGAGEIEAWASAREHRIQTTRLFLDEPLPAVDDFDLVVVMGGPMGVYDDVQFSWLSREKEFIGRSIENKKRVLGICLGAQLIASVLGADVYPGPAKEVGWFPIELNPSVRNHPLSVLPPQRTVFHWHGDTFDLPANSIHLARSQACENQAFAYGSHVLGFQFHIELSPGQIEALIKNCPADLAPGPFVMPARGMLELASTLTPPLHAALFQILDQFTLGA